MREYTIQKITGAPDWTTVPILPIDCLQWSPEVPIRAQAQICYDDNSLYVRQVAVEPNIRAEESGPLGIPCDDSCLEFFFCPINGDIRYFNIECNPNGCVYLGFGYCLPDLVRLVPKKMPVQPKAEYTPDGWQVSYSFPFSFVRLFFPDFNPVSGSTIRANCYKCGDETVQPHFLSWNPINTETPAFHIPEGFGLMRFE